MLYKYGMDTNITFKCDRAGIHNKTLKIKRGAR